MSKRPSLFGTAAAKEPAVKIEDDQSPTTPAPAIHGGTRPPSRAGKRVLSVYLDPEAWKQLRTLGIEEGLTTQALGVEALNLLFAARGKNRIA